MATVGSSKRHLNITSDTLTTSSNVDVGAKLFITTTDSNTSSTTALVLNSTEVEARTLGSNAFNSTAFLTSETFSSSDVALVLSGNDIIAGTSITLAGGLSYNNSTSTLSQTDNNTTYTAGTGITLTGTAFSVTTGTYAAASHDHSRILENTTIAYGGGQLQWTDLSGNGGTGLNGAAPGNPFSDWFHHIIMNHANSSGYYVDIAACFHSDDLYFRRNVAGTLSTWREIYHTGNLTPLTIGTTATTAMAGNTSIPSGNQIIDWTVDNDNIVIHSGNYTDTDTWIANSATAAGYVASGANQANKVWKTDANGNPGWATDRDTVYTHPTDAGNKHIPTGGSAGQFLKYSASGTATWATPSYTTNTDTVYTHPTSAGNKHIPTGGSAGQFLKYSASGTATWATPSYTTNTDTQLSNTEVIGMFTAGTNVTISSEGVIAATDTDTVYTHPTSAGNKHIPTGGSAGQFLKYSADGTATWATPSYTTNTNTQLSQSEVVGMLTAGTNVTISAEGVIASTDTDTVYTHPTTAGNKHIPTGGAAGQFLKYSADGTATWATPSYTTNTNTTYSAGTGLDLTGTTFSVEPDLRDGITHVGKDANNYIQFDSTNGRIDFYAGGVFVARMESDGDLHIKGDVIAFSNIFS